MRFFAATLRVKAGAFTTVGDQAVSAVGKIDGQGRYLKRYKTDARLYKSAAGTIAEKLASAAALLEQEATRVEAEIAAERRRAAAQAAAEAERSSPGGGNPIFDPPWGA